MRRVELEQVLAARDARVCRQKKLLNKYGGSLIVLTLVLPGPYKQFPLAWWTFREGERALLTQLNSCQIPLKHMERYRKATGPEGYYLAPGNPVQIKKLALDLEENHPIGRLLDIDVIDASGELIKRQQLGGVQRRCLICAGPVWECARQRHHDTSELLERVESLMKDFFSSSFADRIASQAIRALLYEVSTTPKPGLVDRMDRGAHEDMGYLTFLDSAAVLHPYFRQVTQKSMQFEGAEHALVQILQEYGLQAERDMLAATGGVNTHKGVIFSLGLLCAATGRLFAKPHVMTLDNVLKTAGKLAHKRSPAGLRARPTHGQTVWAAYGHGGAYEEAVGGFPNVAAHGYPRLRQALERGFSINGGGIASLLHLMAHVADTNVLYRAGGRSLKTMQQLVRTFLEGNPSEGEMAEFCEKNNPWFVQMNISAGGCADLLALSYFLYFILDEQICTYGRAS